MNNIRPGDVVLIDVPFTDLSHRKKRPALVLIPRQPDYLVSFFTSRLERAGSQDIVIRASAENGLAVDSAILVTKLFTLHESLIVRPIGRLSTSDHRAVVQRLLDLLTETLDE
jgi:mRNA interferase MazF